VKISELIYENECISYIENKEKKIDNISLDPFKLTGGTLFIALRRKSYKIEDLKSHLESKSGLTVVCDENLLLDEKKIDVIRVRNLRKISAFIYSRFYKINYEKLTFIGVTGTNGKTTTATLIERLIMNIGNVGFIGTGKIRINGVEISDPLYSMTTPDVDLLYKTVKDMQNAGCKYIVMEASSHALYFDKLAPIPFKVSLFTNLSSEHGDFHKSEEEYFLAKFKLFMQSKIGIFNLDDSYSKRAFVEFLGTKYSVAISAPADTSACDTALLSHRKSEFIYREKSVICSD
jgi:UDP-N-acetylmuramoyl-L-alanyl-D-glutamate--2,6-diaminopimelate ligase